jgi:hypothetical protein
MNGAQVEHRTGDLMGVPGPRVLIVGWLYYHN